MNRLLTLAALTVSLAALAGSAPAPAQLRRRFVLAVGSNDGRPARPLKHARSDARAFAEVLRDLGGVRAADSWLLENPSEAQLRSAIAAATERVVDSRRDVPAAELVFYFSGHSDESGVWLAGHRMPYLELRAALRGVPADFRVAVLDSCASGSFTRSKGGERVPAFLSDASATVKGEVALTSSAEREPSQESDRLGSSYFTHHLLSGLRGAADISRDGKVTLDEAYRYAFDQTLAGTEGTTGGGQHPAYEMALSGSGEVVMTDLRSSAATLAVDAAVAGQLFVRGARGNLVVEVVKQAGVPLELGLAPGLYRVTVANGAKWASAEVRAVAGARVQLQPAQLQEVAAEENLVRGGEEQLEPGRLALHGDLALMPIYFPFLSDPGFSHSAIQLEGRLTLGTTSDPAIHPEMRRFLEHPHELSFRLVNLSPHQLSAMVFVLPSTGLGGSLFTEMLLPRGWSVSVAQYFEPAIRLDVSFRVFGGVAYLQEADAVIGLPPGGDWRPLWSAQAELTAARSDRFRLGVSAGFDQEKVMLLNEDGFTASISDVGWFRGGASADAFFLPNLWARLEVGGAWASLDGAVSLPIHQVSVAARLEWSPTPWLSVAGVLLAGDGHLPHLSLYPTPLMAYLSPTGSVRARF